jgi:VWFA-related protein
MPISFRIAGPGVLAFAAALALASVASGQAPAPPPRINAGETVNVEVKIVPFYAVDAQGNPVYDLRQDEIELRVGGARVPVESFDRYVIQSGRAGAEASPLTPTPSRTVFFLFDQTFSSSAGFNTDKRLAARMVRSWPGGDRLFLMVHGTGAGIERKLGPVPPDAEGKKELLAAIEALQPEARRLELQEDTTADYGAAAGKASRGKFSGAAPADQRAAVDDGIQGSVRNEYHGIARGFAGALGDFASELRRISGPKLLVLFSQGMDSGLYFQGSSGYKVGSDEGVEVDSRRAPPLVDRFRQPLAALAESGTALLFVNTDRGQEPDADAVLRHMAQTTGGLYVEGRDPQSLEKRIAGSTTAYYEASFHPAASLLQRDSAAVEVTVRRPGVRVWAPAAVRTRESYQALSALEKQRMVIDLLSGGPAAQRAHSPVRLSVQTLEGRVIGQAASGHPGLRFEAAWPADLATRKLDVYNVLFAPPAEGKKGKILRFDRREAVASAGRAAFETALEGEGSLVWGIVAVDPETQRTWLCRLVLKSPEKAAK